MQYFHMKADFNDIYVDRVVYVQKKRASFESVKHLEMIIFTQVY